MSLKILILLKFVSLIGVVLSIEGGQFANIEDYPYQVGVLFNETIGCGGTLITNTHVLTSVLCIFLFTTSASNPSELSQLSIRVGSRKHSEGGIIKQIKEIHIHENFNDMKRFLNNDLAILVLSEAVSFSDTIEAIELASENPNVGDVLNISGWGSDMPGNDYVENLLAASTKVISYQESLQFLRPTTIGVESNDIFISNGGGGGACVGDHGGPIAGNGKLFGVISWSENCKTTVYTSVASASAKHFIDRVLNSVPKSNSVFQ